jgi:hypothetical protein
MKRTVLGALCVGAAAVAMATLGTGTAAADDYSGKTYKDAQSALSDASQKGVVAARFGDELSDDDCIVTHSQKAAWLKGDSFAPVTDTVLLYLNCDAGVASATQAGNSAASPEGRAAIAEAKKEAAKKAADASGDAAATSGT